MEHCDRQPWCLKGAGHPGDCHETPEERTTRINAQARRDHPFEGAGQYCQSWGPVSLSGSPTTGLVTFRSRCGYPREHHPDS